jgi:hypothetical protein
MALVTNFNANPYYDDFDEDKKFLRLLFRPGYAVQARELTQIQSLLQNQINRFGDWAFKNGSKVSGGQFFNQTATYINLSPIYVETSVVANNFLGQTILSIDESKRAKVLKVYDADAGTGEPITLMVAQIFGNTFTSGETIKTNEVTPYFANTTGVGEGLIFSVNEGVYYYDGYFIQTDPQTVAVSKYTTVGANVRCGYEVTESIVTPSSDTSLLDPAQDASNYQAPGSDRYKIDLILSTRAIDSEDDERFINLQVVEESVVTETYEQTQLAVLGDTLARRTFDESGNYTVQPFRIAIDTNDANSANMDITLSPGKAYVYGYEFNKNAPTTITVEKPRDFTNVANKRVTASYGGFIYTTNHEGNFPVLNMDTIELHCVNTASVNALSSGARANTRIGTARINQIAYDSSANLSNSSTYEYRSYLFDLQINQNITGNVINATTFIDASSGREVSNVVIGNSTFGLLLSNVNQAYRGARLIITDGPGSGEGVFRIDKYDGTSKTLTLSSSFFTLPTDSSKYEIDFEFLNIKSLGNWSGTSLVCSADVSSKAAGAGPADPIGEVYSYNYITDTDFSPTIFRLGEAYIKQNTISDMSYSYKRLYEAQTFSSNVSPALPVGTGENITAAPDSLSVARDYHVVVSTAGTSGYAVGDIVPADKISVNTSTRQLTITNSQNMVANIYATIDVTNPTYKQKTYVAANTTINTSATSIDVFGNSAVILYPTLGQVHIANTYVVKTPDGIQTLFASDLINLVQVLDFEGATISEANRSGATDVTTKYFFDDGQRNSAYTWGSLRFRPKVRPPQGPLVVYFDRFTSSGPGFFTVDSYTANNITNFEYGSVPIYNSPNIGRGTGIYQLRDVLDFRPVVKDPVASGGSAIVFDVASTGPKIPDVGSDIILDYEYYLPRIDKVILDKNKDFEVIKGNSSLNPAIPKDTDTGMTLYTLFLPPYTANTSEIRIDYKNNKRYTMRDIGTLEDRISNLEYYTTLSLLEQGALNKQDLSIRDTENLVRFKNGVLVDGFTGSSVADVLNPDYAASIDPARFELRPSFNITAHSLTFDVANSSNFLRSGPIVTANAAPVAMIDQPKASRFINVNPFNVVNFIGTITLDPPTDFWVDTNYKADVFTADIGGDLDAWTLLAQGAAQTEWGSWENRVIGTVNETARFQNDAQGRNEALRNAAGNLQLGGANDIVEVTRRVDTVERTRTGTMSTATVGRITESLGERVVDVSVIQYMREINILFVGVDFRPNQTLYPFFDGKSVENNVGNRVNKFFLDTNDIGLKRTASDPEFITIKRGVTTIGTGVVAHVSNNIVYVTNIAPTSNFGGAGITITGDTTGLTYDVTGYEHNGGQAVSATSTTITLRQDVIDSTNYADFNSAPIFIAQGTGAGQSATISSYNPATRVATISGTWSTTPDSSSFYSIGRMRTDAAGGVTGIFTVPAETFRTGQKLFRLVDNASGDIGSSRTNGEQTFFAQGLLQTRERVAITTIVPNGIRRESVSESTTEILRSGAQARVVWTDPLAETFLVSPVQYPQGVFLSKIRLCFKSKDSQIPVTVQVRPVVNGYPSSSEIYPFATVSLTPDKVKITDEPDLDDENKYTEFEFDMPLFLQPGEHSFVILANSNEYETYIAEIGKRDLVTGRQISEQAYGGSLFLSQNGSTWTADQSSDLMFRMFRYRFDQVSSDLRFLVNYPEGIVNYDLVNIITNDIVTQNTAINYQFNSQTLTEDYAGFREVIPLSDYTMDDGAGTRVLVPTTGNSTFELAAALSTLNPDISPFIDVTRLGILGVENRINNLELSNDDIQIVTGGSGYANSADVTVTITGGNGFGATAQANVVGGEIVDIEIVDAGSGYSETPTVTITAGSGGGSGATAVVAGETSKSGGNALARYITRRVILAEGFDSGDLRVYLTAYKPIGSNIHVYAKYLSASDPEKFEDKKWQRLTQLGNANFVSENRNDYRELTFAPGTDEISANKIFYTNDAGIVYDTYKTFAIKIVMSSDITYDVPKIRDFRAIALPAKSTDI